MSLTEEQKKVLSETRNSPEYLKRVATANSRPLPEKTAVGPTRGTKLTLSLGLLHVNITVDVPDSENHTCEGNGSGQSSGIKCTGTIYLEESSSWEKLIQGPCTYDALAQTNGKVSANFYVSGVFSAEFDGTTTASADLTADCNGDCKWT